jgi:anti-sigma-K factor RskA
MRYQNKTLTDLLAAEYALGTLKGRARQRFERLLQRDPTLRSQLEGWERRLNQLADRAPPVAPPAAVWTRLEQRLFAQPVKPRWFEQLAFWRALTLGSGALAGILAVLLWLDPGAMPPGYVMLIQDRAQQPVWTASAATDMKQFYVRNMHPMDMPPGRGCLLWVQPQGSDRVYALGVLPDDGGMMRLEIDEPLRSQLPNAKLMVTLEDMTNPPPAPTRPAEFTGQVVALTSTI